MKSEARKGLDWRKEFGRGGTRIGLERANQIVNGENLSDETIKRMFSYLSRAEEFYDEGNKEACGTISYLLWGGLAGKRWAESKLKELGQI